MLHTFQNISLHPEFFGFYTDRHFGFSKGNYSDFNCNLYAGDDENDVMKNRAWLANKLNAHLVIPHQTHGTEILLADALFAKSSKEQQLELADGKDAVMTSLCGYAVCISTADCIPILLCDTQNHAVAAVHAGWRGTQKRIAQLTVEAMRKQFGTQPKNIVAAIGPGISATAFEVGEEVCEAFAKANFEMDDICFLNPKTNKHHIDLKKCNQMQLQDCGVNDIEVSGICTFNHTDDYFSARRLGTNSGRILSGILIR